MLYRLTAKDGSAMTLTFNFEPPKSNCSIVGGNEASLNHMQAFVSKFDDLIFSKTLTLGELFKVKVNGQGPARSGSPCATI